MNASTFDTLQYAKKLKAVDVPEKQAEVSAEALRAAFDERDKALADLEAKVQELATSAKSNAEKMATKEDILRLENKIGGLEGKIGSLEDKMVIANKDLLLKLYGTIGAAVTVLLGAIGLAVKYLSH